MKKFEQNVGNSSKFSEQLKSFPINKFSTQNKIENNLFRVNFVH
jgi:hypothetical protein